MLRTVDTDVVVLSVATFRSLNVVDMWIAFGVGSQFRYVAIHDIVNALGKEKSRVLPVLHAFTGCNQTYSFNGRGKCMAWRAWMACEEVTTSFASLSERPSLLQVHDAIPVLERFVVIMYDEQVLVRASTKPEKISSPRKEDLLRTYLLQVMPYFNTS